MIAIIPARGGSKGLPNKNIKLMNGKPLIAYSILSALNSPSIDQVIVSTNDPEIADIAKSYGASVPFLRPAELSTDDSLAVDAYIYTVNQINNNRNVYDKISEVVILLPTAPLRISSDIDNAIELFRKKNADSVVSWAELNHPVEWCKKISASGKFLDPINDLKNRQEYSPSYFPVGVVYVFKFEILLSKRYYTENSYAYIVPKSRAVEIDTIEDFLYAETLMKFNAII